MGSPIENHIEVIAKAPTVSELYLSVRRAFIKAGIDNAEFEAKEILHVVLGKTRADIVRDAYQYVSDATPEKVQRLVEKRLTGMPLAYVLGQWDFFANTLEITPDVLIPRSDTEILAAAVLTYVQGYSSPRVLDLCCGSGCIGLTIAMRMPESHVVMGDISLEALKIAKINAQNCKNTIVAVQMDALNPPLSSQLGVFDAIVCNPPYLTHEEYENLDRSVKDFEPKLALYGGGDGLDFYRSVARDWKCLLGKHGALFFEVGYTQAEAVADILRMNEFKNVEIYKDLSGIDRVVTGHIIPDEPVVQAEISDTAVEDVKSDDVTSGGVISEDIAHKDSENAE